MKHFCLYLLILITTFSAVFTGCFLKRDTSNSKTEEFDNLGISVKIPENFKALPINRFEEVSLLETTIINAEPFTVNPLYIYGESSGKGFIVLSDLKLTETAPLQEIPFDNLKVYKKNIEKYFGVEEITSEEIWENSVTTLLTAISLNNNDGEVFLFKGLCYIYPDRFLVIDLYVDNKYFTDKDADEYINMFYSIKPY